MHSSNPLSNLRYKLLAATKSPRRQYLLREMGLTFDVVEREVDESFPHHLKGSEIPVFLAEKKAAAFSDSLAEDELLLTADTVVWIDDKVLNKPVDRAEALGMLSLLSGNRHEVFTGVCLRTAHRTVSFSDRTEVFFRELTQAEMEFYVDNFSPFDKAGSYGAQDWIGLAGVERINGSYFNVMGLPMHRVYSELLKFL